MANITVTFAVYGALKGGDENIAQSMDAKSQVQNLINQNDGIVTINNENMGDDPCPGNTKHFGAQIEREGGTYHFACQEGQTIDFEHGGNPA